MKTLLINPDSPKMYGIGGQCAFPLGLGYIAAVLEKDHEVKLIDVAAEKLDDDSLRDRILKISPEIVGITSDTISFQRAIAIAELIQQIDKEIVIVIGGAHCNALPTYPLKYDCFDISVYGEGERTACELWHRIERRKSYDDVRGIVFRKNGKIVINPKRELIDNLDELPFPARHLFAMNKYIEESHLYAFPVYPIGTSRGCPFSCAFCSNNVVFGRKYRFRSARNVVDEIEILINEYNAKGIYFREDLFTVNAKRVIDVCNEIKKRKLDFKWECESRVDTINEEMLRVMKDAGCELIWFGVESGSQEILDYINKKFTIKQVRNAFRLSKKTKLRAGASFIIGVPGEKIEDIYKTIDFAKELKPDFAWFNIFTGYPTSPLYEYVVKNSLYEKKISHGILIIRTDNFNREKLEKMQIYGDRKVNRNIKKLFKKVLFEIKHGNLTKDKMMKGIKYIKHYYFGSA